MAKAAGAGFTRENGTLGEMYEVIRESDLALLLISDAAMAENYRRVFDALRSGKTLGLLARVPPRAPAEHRRVLPRRRQRHRGVSRRAWALRCGASTSRARR